MGHVTSQNNLKMTYALKKYRRVLHDGFCFLLILKVFQETFGEKRLH